METNPEFATTTTTIKLKTFQTNHCNLSCTKSDEDSEQGEKYIFREQAVLRSYDYQSQLLVNLMVDIPQKRRGWLVSVVVC